jgi:hypothetical protein
LKPGAQRVTKGSGVFIPIWGLKGIGGQAKGAGGHANLGREGACFGGFGRATRERIKFMRAAEPEQECPGDEAQRDTEYNGMT